MGLLVVGMEGGIVHKPLQAAFAIAGVCGGAVVSEVDMEIYRDVRFRDSCKWEQWHGHVEIILEDYDRVSFARLIVPLRSDLRCGNHDRLRHMALQLMSVSCSCLLPRSRSWLMHGSGNESGCH